MKRVWLMAAAATLLMASPTLANPIYGNWKSAPGDGGAYIHVKISPCGPKICGTITKVVGKKNSKIIGRSIIKNMNDDGGGSYSGGTIWAPDKKKTYASKMKLRGNKLSVSGCIAGGLICRSQTWTRL
ncbi:Uncharacterized conserved protein, DUF2147 family [Cohaesibacter sp. ES.047]|uniref:DUF2147 domain-containing protein n=1 Tax=Cohaesibacter sp. ES.047 TaxID=1798205 RepID=UPI000BB75C66|nr:DUF2147 domain-containing protein [Cohaesibacter sp. ES.047]SNY94033.1 Uncharacterized conserved protein, DUF2147 family [Cohaesibacter sp. ES.047]